MDDNLCFICCSLSAKDATDHLSAYSFVNGPTMYNIRQPETTFVLAMPCLCKTKIHLFCLLTLIRIQGDQCKTCRTHIGSETDSRGRITFPELGIYQSPLGCSYFNIDLNDAPIKLKYAVLFLQCKRVEAILKSMTKAEFRTYEGLDHHGLHKMDQDTQSLVLIDNPYNNMPRQFNQTEYARIDKLLYDKTKSLR